MLHVESTTVNREYFVVKIFSDSLACAKIKHSKYMCSIISNAVQGRLSEIYLARKFITQNIFGTKYLQYIVHVSFNRILMVMGLHGSL